MDRSPRPGRDVSAQDSPRSRRRLLRQTAALVACPALGALAFAARRGGAPPGGLAVSLVASAVPASPAAGTPAASPVATGGRTWTVHTTEGLRFDPEELRIAPGDTVTWVNDSPLPHSATGDPAQNPVARSHPEYVALPEGAEPWGSPLLQPGQTWSHTFTVPGEYRYLCISHVLGGMRGKITVAS